MRRLGVLRTGAARGLLLALALCAAASDGSAQEQPALPADEFVEHVERAAHDHDAARLRELAAAQPDDIWELAVRVADHDAAAADALARAVTTNDLEPLVAYLAVRRERRPEPAVRAAIASETTGDDALAAVDAALPRADPFATVQLRLRRAELLGAGEPALAEYADAVETARRLGWLHGQSLGLARGAMTALKLGDVDRARRDMQAHVVVERKRGAHGHAIAALNNLAGVAVWSGAFEDARVALEELSLAPELADATGPRADVLQNLAYVLGLLGRGRESLATYLQALSLRGEVDDPLARVELRFHVADAYDALGDFEQALAIQTEGLREYERAVGERRDAAIVGTLARYRGSVARTQLHMGEYAEALAGFEESLAVVRELGDGAATIVLTSHCAEALLRLGRHDAACARAAESLALAEERGEKRLLADVLAYDLAASHLAAGRLDEALAYTERAIGISDELGQRPLLAEAHMRRGEILYAQGRHVEANDACETAFRHVSAMVLGLPEGVNAKARARNVGVIQLALRVAAARDDAETFFTWMERGRAGALLDTIRNRDAIKAARIPDDLRRAEAVAREEESLAEAAHTRALEAGLRKDIRLSRQRLAAARSQVDAVVTRARLSRSIVSDLLYPRADSLVVAQTRLASTDVLVAYSLVDEQAFAFVLRRADARIVPLGPTAAIRDAAGRVAQLVQGAESASEHAVSSAEQIVTLSKLVIEPLGLRERETTVLVSPDQALFAVPFALLLGDRAVAYVPSATTHGVLKASGALRGKTIVGIGDPMYERSRGLAPLAGAAAELQATVRGGPLLLGADATETALVATIAKQPRWRALHFACHGVCDVEDPLSSRLELTAAPGSDGRLTAEEVLELSLPVDLVALSACETGTGTVLRGEGLVGLTRAFMVAGAPRVIATLCRVDDAASRALMVRFYELWSPADGKPGTGAAQALRDAQAFVASHEKWRHPRFWAPWVLWGLPD